MTTPYPPPDPEAVQHARAWAESQQGRPYPDVRPQPPYGYATGGYVSPPPVPRKRRHIFRWIFLAVQVLFLAWIIGGAASSSTASSCAGLHGSALQTCQDAGHAGTAVGIGLVIFLWAAIDVILGVSYLIFGRRGR